MGKFRVYITPFDDAGDYTTEVDVTDDVLSMGDISRQLDQNEYNVGILKFSDVTIQLRNDHGYYSKAGDINSIFQLKINESKCRITWHPRGEPTKCGWFHCGDHGPIGEEILVFKGILSDIATKTDIDQQTATLKVLGYEHILSLLEVPYSSISNGQNLSVVIYTMLNQTRLTDLVTVSQANIVLGIDATIDDKTDLENKKVSEVIKDMLLVSNSVLRIEGTTLYVSSRDAGADLITTFYGPGSTEGLENILDIRDYREGSNRIINFATWKDTTIEASDTDSIETYGIRKQEYDLSIITDTTKRTNFITDIVTEFESALREMTISIPISMFNLTLELLDRVSIDYPTIAFNEGTFSVYGFSEYDTDDRYAYENQTLSIDSASRFKIVAIRISDSNELMEVQVREIVA